MRKIIFVFLIAMFCISVSAQTTPKLKIWGIGLGKITVSKGKTRSIIDLSTNIAGCAFTPKEFKRDLDKKGCTAPPATFELVDATEKNNQTFLILTADAQENCNVCGRCGASEATTFIWLKLDAKLKLLERQNVLLEYCGLNITMIQPLSDFDEKTQKETLDVPFKDNVMTIEFERPIYGEEAKGDKDVFEFTHIEYDRTKPEKGFVTKTEKRDKSSAPDQ